MYNNRYNNNNSEEIKIIMLVRKLIILQCVTISSTLVFYTVK